MIPVVFSTDDGYAMPTAVAIKSMLDNYSGNEIEIYILFKDSLSPLSKAIMERAIEKTFNEQLRAVIHYLDVGEKMNIASSHISHISSATYYRVILPELLNTYDRCIYLDGDVIVAGDIADLTFIEMTDNDYIAGVSTVMIQTCSESVRQERIRIIGIPDFKTYVNAGMLLLNLKAMRDNGLVEKMMDLVPKAFPVQDQDIINVVCYGHVKTLSPRFNVLPSIYRMSPKKLRMVYKQEEIDDARKNPCVIHYADKRKPWKYDNIIEGDRWRTIYNSMFSCLNVESNHYGAKAIIREFLMRATRKTKKVLKVK